MRQHFTPGGALAEILRRDAANGVDVFDDGGVPRPTPGPPLSIPPLARPVIPEPDWRREQEEIARRDAKPPALEENEASLSPVPAKRRRKSSTSKTEVHSATPNLDEVRSWVEVER